MRSRLAMALGAVLLALIIVADLGLGLALLSDPSTLLLRGWRLFAALPRPTGLAARLLAKAGRDAIAGGAVVALCSQVLGTLLGSGTASLPHRSGRVLAAAATLPGWTALLAFALTSVLMVGRLGTVACSGTMALAGAFDTATAGGIRATLVAISTPLLAAAFSRSLSRLDRSALEAAATMGLGPGARLLRLVLPEVLPVMLAGVLAVFLASAAMLFVRAVSGVPPQPDPDAPAIAALAFAAALLVSAAALLLPSRRI